MFSVIFCVGFQSEKLKNKKRYPFLNKLFTMIKQFFHFGKEVGYSVSQSRKIFITVYQNRKSYMGKKPKI